MYERSRRGICSSLAPVQRRWFSMAMMAANDWQCPNVSCMNHTKLVFGKNSSCPKCGAQRGDGEYDPDEIRAEKGMMGGDLPSDWQCPNENCMNNQKMVFGKHQSCPKCGAHRNAKQPGDWQCPNVACRNHQNTVFASKTHCPKCGAARPGFGGGAYAGGAYAGGGYGGGYVPPRGNMIPMQPSHGVWMGSPPPMMGRPTFGAPSFGPSFGGPITGNPADWQCPNTSCMNHRKMVFGKHTNCPQCGQTKPSGRMNGGMPSGMHGMGSMHGGGMGMFGGGCGSGGGGSHPGDWQCPNQDCKNHRNGVFAKHSQCPACGADNPGAYASAMGGRRRSRSPYRPY